MEVNSKKIDGNRVEISVKFSHDELKPYLEKAAIDISNKVKIDGFRPGHASFDVIKSKVGEMEIYEQAAKKMISKTCYEVMDEQKLRTVGQPEVDVSKLAPGNDFEYKIVASLFPSVEVTDYSKKEIKKKEVNVDEKEVDKVIDNLRGMRSTEKLEDRAAIKGDKIEVDFDILLDKVIIENGSYKKFSFVAGDGSMLPDFEKQIMGMKANEKKEFELTFPKEYFEKNLANKKCLFKVELKAVYSVTLPEIDSEFVKNVGQGQFKDVEDLYSKIRENLKTEGDKKEEVRIENEMFDYLIEKSKFETIPDVLVTSETKKMIEELKHNVTQQGLNFEDYLSRLNKTESDLMLDMSPEALKRVKAALIIFEVGKTETIDSTDDEVKKETEHILSHNKGDKEFEQYVKSPQYQEYVKNNIMNKKVVEYLRTAMIK